MASVREIANQWHMTERNVASLCKKGKIKGAVKEKGNWIIPDDAQKPIDGRIKTGKYIKQKKSVDIKLRPLPVGVSDYRVASMKYYYVDKTMLIKDFLDERPFVSLFTRPRRFGKTLNMDMLRTFFEKTNEDTSIYFQNKAVWKYEDCRAEQGKYPVVFVSFKDIKCDTWEETIEKLGETLRNEYARHSELASSPKCNDVDKDYYRRIMEGKASVIDLESAFSTLTRMLYEHHCEKCVVIIDEYDTPIQQGYTRNYYAQVVSFMRNLFSGGLKDNSYLAFGFLTGILRVARESIFSGLNNLVINSIMDRKYSTYFGFTIQDVKDMAKYYRAADKYAELCEWYDGYHFGETDIFNPWSVINYFRNDCRPGTYWQSTGSNEIIGEVLSEAGFDIYDRLSTLLRGESMVASIDTNVVYPEIRKNPASVFSFLLVAGYLKIVEANEILADGMICRVALPNKEIYYVYKKEILDRLSLFVPQTSSMAIQEALYAGDAEELQRQIHQLLLQSASVYDTVGENFYHGLVLGLCAMMTIQYQIRSNRESGEGRYDIQLMPKDSGLPGILIELKAAKNKSEEGLNSLAQAALNQIHERKYDTELLANGVTKIYKYGVAFSGKNVAILVE